MSEACAGCGKSDPAPTWRNHAGYLVHVNNKCVKRAHSKAMKAVFNAAPKEWQDKLRGK